MTCSKRFQLKYDQVCGGNMGCVSNMGHPRCPFSLYDRFRQVLKDRSAEGGTSYSDLKNSAETKM